MARTPPRPRQPSLPFPPDADEAAVPQGGQHSDEGGSRDAVQDDGSRTPPAAPADVRTALPPTDTGGHNGALRRRAEGQPRRLEGAALPGEAGERREPDRERSPGAGAGTA